jgi:hypothetical protein
MQPSSQSHAQLQRSMRASSSSSNAMGYHATSFTPSAALIASWPVPQYRRFNLLPEVPGSSSSALSGDDHDRSSMVEDTKFGECQQERFPSTQADLASPALSHVHHQREEGSSEPNLTEVKICLGVGGETGPSTSAALVDW